MNKTIILIILSIFLLSSCKSDVTTDKFDNYCSNYCESFGMIKSDETKEETHTLNCVCEKIFLKEEWVREND